MLLYQVETWSNGKDWCQRIDGPDSGLTLDGFSTFRLKPVPKASACRFAPTWIKRSIDGLRILKLKAPMGDFPFASGWVRIRLRGVFFVFLFVPSFSLHSFFNMRTALSSYLRNLKIYNTHSRFTHRPLMYCLRISTVLSSLCALSL